MFDATLADLVLSCQKQQMLILQATSRVGSSFADIETHVGNFAANPAYVHEKKARVQVLNMDSRHIHMDSSMRIYDEFYRFFLTSMFYLRPFLKRSDFPPQSHHAESNESTRDSYMMVTTKSGVIAADLTPLPLFFEEGMSNHYYAWISRS